MDSSFLEQAQQSVNFIILWPSALPSGYEVQNISLREETESTRSSLWFEIVGGESVVRVKQFFYDWGTPVVLADTNLVSPGKSFEVDGIVGFIGRDYKGNQAVCYSKWFTNMELSVKRGAMSEADLIEMIKTFVPLNPSSIQRLGKQSFTTISHTARFRKPKWQEDEISRVRWYENTFNVMEKLSPHHLLVPSFSYEEYFLDSVGYSEGGKGIEAHFLLRSGSNYTDGIWVWLAPKEMVGPLSATEGDDIGIRQSWHVKKEKLLLEGKETELFIGRQNVEHYGWYVHWEYEKHVYQIFVRPSVNFDYHKLSGFLHTFTIDHKSAAY